MKLFNDNKWDKWYNAQPPHIQAWMDKPGAIWHDIDMLKAGIVGFIVGAVVALLIRG
jgi:hypothetical protein